MFDFGPYLLGGEAVAVGHEADAHAAGAVPALGEDEPATDPAKRNAAAARTNVRMAGIS